MARLFAQAMLMAATTALVSTAIVETANAGGRRSLETYDRAGWVIARSEFGNGAVRGPVRRTRLGRQVRLPGGSWVYCETSCTETLRLKTVDFWHSDQGAGPQNSTTHGGGIFGKLRLW